MSKPSHAAVPLMRLESKDDGFRFIIILWLQYNTRRWQLKIVTKAKGIFNLFGLLTIPCCVTCMEAFNALW
jgi:hypothetical protein